MKYLGFQNNPEIWALSIYQSNIYCFWFHAVSSIPLIPFSINLKWYFKSYRNVWEYSWRLNLNSTSRVLREKTILEPCSTTLVNQGWVMALFSNLRPRTVILPYPNSPVWHWYQVCGTETIRQFDSQTFSIKVGSLPDHFRIWKSQKCWIKNKVSKQESVRHLNLGPEMEIYLSSPNNHSNISLIESELVWWTNIFHDMKLFDCQVWDIHSFVALKSNYQESCRLMVLGHSFSYKTLYFAQFASLY